jgi:hypothetical protein
MAGILSFISYNRELLSKASFIFYIFVIGWLALSISLYPATLLTDDPYKSTHEDTKTHISLQEQAAYDFSGYGNTLVTARRGAFYTAAMGINVNTDMDIRVYALNSGSVTDGSLVIVRPWIKRSHPTYGNINRYRVPQSIYQSYDYQSNWQRIYSNGDNQLYHVQ